MKKVLGSLAIIGALFFNGCGDEWTLTNVINQRVMVQNGMTKVQVQKILKNTPDEISQVGNYEMWIYKGEITKNEKTTFNDYIIKFVDGKVAYTGYFRCKLPNVED